MQPSGYPSVNPSIYLSIHYMTNWRRVSLDGFCWRGMFFLTWMPLPGHYSRLTNWSRKSSLIETSASTYGDRLSVSQSINQSLANGPSIGQWCSVVVVCSWVVRISNNPVSSQTAYRFAQTEYCWLQTLWYVIICTSCMVCRTWSFAPDVEFVYLVQLHRCIVILWSKAI